MPDSKPISIDAYDRIAERYASQIDTNAYNACYERPATLSLLPDVRGKRALDVGCGPGAYAQWLFEHGAEVIAVDASPEMARIARGRLPDAVDVRLADISAPLDFVESGSIHVVVAALVLDGMRDWSPALAEVRRVLSPGGTFVFSVGHPMEELHHSPSGNYFETERLEVDWPGYDVRMPSYRRPLGAMLDALFSAGLRPSKVLEPRPTEECRVRHPEVHEELSRVPWFLCIRAEKAV